MLCYKNFVSKVFLKEENLEFYFMAGKYASFLAPFAFIEIETKGFLSLFSAQNGPKDWPLLSFRP